MKLGLLPGLFKSSCSNVDKIPCPCPQAFSHSLRTVLTASSVLDAG